MKIQSLFDRYNRRFWKGKLKGWTVHETHTTDLPPAIAPSRWRFGAGQQRHGDFGDCDNDSRRIFVQIGLSSAERRKTLLHEMCHAATSQNDDIHGPSWQNEMFRIDKLGARGMAAEARQFEHKKGE